jgi:hypothetical protein
MALENLFVQAGRFVQLARLVVLDGVGQNPMGGSFGRDVAASDLAPSPDSLPAIHQTSPSVGALAPV